MIIVILFMKVKKEGDKIMDEKINHNHNISNITRRLNGKSPICSTWAIILAGGDGERMKPFVEEWMHEERPKQFCSFLGDRTLLQQTVDRARTLVSDDHIITVVGNNHLQYLINQHLPGKVISQPKTCGTASGIYVALSHIMEIDPYAVVLVFPSDHFVQPEDRFYYHAYRTSVFAQYANDNLFLLGAIPTSPESDYGWIKPVEEYVPDWSESASTSTQPYRIVDFCEKPVQEHAELLKQQGYLWNTMIVAGKANVFWTLGRIHQPDLMKAFTRYRTIVYQIMTGDLERTEESAALARLHESMKPFDFSKDILEHAFDMCSVIPMTKVDWSDWGTPERIKNTFLKYNLIKSSFMNKYYDYKMKELSIGVL